MAFPKLDIGAQLAIHARAYPEVADSIRLLNQRANNEGWPATRFYLADPGAGLVWDRDGGYINVFWIRDEMIYVARSNDFVGHQPEISGIIGLADPIPENLLMLLKLFKDTVECGDDGYGLAEIAWQPCDTGGVLWICPICDGSRQCERRGTTTEIRCGSCKYELGKAEWLTDMTSEPESRAVTGAAVSDALHRAHTILVDRYSGPHLNDIRADEDEQIASSRCPLPRPPV